MGIADRDMVDAPKQMGAAHQLDTAVLAGAAVDGDHGRQHLGSEAALAVPRAVVLVPVPPSLAARPLEGELGVPVVDRLAAQQVLGRLDKTGDAHIGAEKVVGDPRPTEQLGALARRVDDLDSVVRDPRIVAREARQRRHFGRAEQPGRNNRPSLSNAATWSAFRRRGAAARPRPYGEC